VIYPEFEKTMPPLRDSEALLRSADRINPDTFVISLRQIAKHLKINPKRIVNWQKYSLCCVRLRLWQHVLWVHLEGRGGYFIS
jgi:hypothetical protein